MKKNKNWKIQITNKTFLIGKLWDKTLLYSLRKSGRVLGFNFCLLRNERTYIKRNKSLACQKNNKLPFFFILFCGFTAIDFQVFLSIGCKISHKNIKKLTSDSTVTSSPILCEDENWTMNLGVKPVIERFHGL